MIANRRTSFIEKRTHHYLCLVAVTLTIVVSSNHLKLEIRPPHVTVHDGCLHDATVWLDDEAVLAVFGLFAGRRGDDEAIHHGTVVTSVSVQGLKTRENKITGIIMVYKDANMVLGMTLLHHNNSVLFLV